MDENPQLVAWSTHAWVGVGSNNQNVFWSRGLPDNVHDKLDSRYGEGRNGAGLTAIDIGVDGHYAAFFANEKYWVAHGPIYSWLTENDIAGADIACVSFGADEYGESTYYIQAKDGQKQWSGASYLERFSELIKSRRQHTVTWATLGAEGFWFLLFSDGATYWGGSRSDALQDKLHDNSKCISRLFVSATNNSRFYILYEDGSHDFCAPSSFKNMMESDKDNMDPQPILYSNSSIKDTFQDGNCVRALSRLLEQREIYPEDIPAIQVATYKGRQWSLDNRRLWAFTHAEVDSVPIIWRKPPHWLKEKVDRGFQGRRVSIRDLPPESECSRSRSRSRDAYNAGCNSWDSDSSSS